MQLPELGNGELKMVEKREKVTKDTKLYQATSPRPLSPTFFSPRILRCLNPENEKSVSLMETTTIFSDSQKLKSA